MPSSATITAFYNFSALTTIRSAQVNANFDVFRGHLISVDPNTLTAAATMTYDLGSYNKMWRGTYNQYGIYYANTSGSVPTPSTSTSYALYFKNDGSLYKKDSLGAETNLDPAASGSSAYEITNLSIAATVGSSALTIYVRTGSGGTPSAGDIVKVGFRDATVTSGTYNQRQITSALSMTISSGSTLGQLSGFKARLFVYLIDNAGTPELAISQRCYTENQLISTTAEGGAGGADSASTIYSTTSRTNVPFRLIGYMDNTQTTAGTWASAPSKIAVGTYNSLMGDAVVLSVGKSTSHNVTTTAGDILNWTTPDVSTGISFNTSTGVATIEISGVYEGSGAISGDATGTYSYYLRYQVDNVTKSSGISSPNAVESTHAITPPISLFLTAGQQVVLKASVNTGTQATRFDATTNRLNIRRVAD